jgi:hypothetical protein
MFRRRLDNDSPGEAAGELRSFVADRLRLAFDLATLGAYELSGPDPESADPSLVSNSSETGAPTLHRREVRGHVSGARAACRLGGEAAPDRCSWGGGDRGQPPEARGQVRRRALLQGGKRRAGATRPAQQPCTWVD